MQISVQHIITDVIVTVHDVESSKREGAYYKT